MREGLCLGQRLARGLRRLPDHALEKLQIQRQRRPGDGFQQALGLGVGERGVMGVNAMHGHLVGCGVRGARQRLPPQEVGVVADPAPVHGTEHDRITHTQKDDAQRPQRVVHDTGRFNPTAA